MRLRTGWKLMSQSAQKCAIPTRKNSNFGPFFQVPKMYWRCERSYERWNHSAFFRRENFGRFMQWHEHGKLISVIGTYGIHSHLKSIWWPFLWHNFFRISFAKRASFSYKFCIGASSSQELTLACSIFSGKNCKMILNLSSPFKNSKNSFY